MELAEHREHRMRLNGGVSVKRYNSMVAMALEETKEGGDTAQGMVWATLALAEATILAGKE